MACVDSCPICSIAPPSGITIYRIVLQSLAKSFWRGFAQSVKEVSQMCELFGIMRKKENRREGKWNSGNRITGEMW